MVYNIILDGKNEFGALSKHVVKCPKYSSGCSFLYSLWRKVNKFEVLVSIVTPVSDCDNYYQY